MNPRRTRVKTRCGESAEHKGPKDFNSTLHSPKSQNKIHTSVLRTYYHERKGHSGSQIQAAGLSICTVRSAGRL